jgi:L-fuculose-phosphate aldolase
MDIKEKIVEVCLRLHAKNMLASADGNVSFRLSNNEIFITPSGISKARMSRDEMCIIDINNNIIKGNPSSERLMHLEVYKKCPEIKAVVHAHPPTAVAFTIAKPELKEIPAGAMSEVILACGSIPIVPYARPGSLDMGTKLHPFLEISRVMILARHGALSVGEDLEEAYLGMERLEHACEILFKASALGGITLLPDQEIQALKDMRAKMEKRTL